MVRIPFYASNATRKYLSAFMDFFGNISVEKLTTDPISGSVHHKFIRVPVMWASTEKWLQVLNSRTSRKGYDPERLDKIPVEIEWALPRIGVNMTGMTYAQERHVGKAQRIPEYTTNYMNNASSAQKNVFAPVPYNLELDLTIIARNMNELFQIVEQIIPFFTPSISLDVKTFDDKPPESVPIHLASIAPDIEEEITETDERVFRCVLSFVMKVNYYLPKRLDKIIERVTTNFGVVPSDTDLSVGADPSFGKFDQYVQVAALDGPLDNDIISFTETPVSRELIEVENTGPYDPNRIYKNGEVAIVNGIKMRYRESVGFIMIGYSMQVGQIVQSPTASGQTNWDV